MATAFFADPRAATPWSPLRRKKNSRNPLCLQFAARLVSAAAARPGRNPGDAVKPLPSFPIRRPSVRPFARRAGLDAVQALSGRRISRAMWRGCPPQLKRFKLHAFLVSAPLPARIAFGLPQRAPEVRRKIRQVRAK
jgi:hypothetical protein